MISGRMKPVEQIRASVRLVQFQIYIVGQSSRTFDPVSIYSCLISRGENSARSDIIIEFE